jgi:hypothetical protein
LAQSIAKRMVKPKTDDHGEKSSGPKGWPGLADCFVGRLGRMRAATTRAALRAFVAAATNRTVSISSGIALGSPLESHRLAKPAILPVFDCN